MSISVIIPSFNRAHTLTRALQSVLAQDHAASEILLIDDGSTDNTAERVQQDFPSVRYCYQDNAGVSAARNLGIAQAKGEWLAFLDSDDAWLPQKLHRQWQALQRQTRYRLCHTDEIWIRHGKRVNPMHKHRKQGGFIFQHCLPLCAISPSSVMIHRTLFDEVGLFDTSLPACEDYDLWLRITASHPVLYLDEALLTKYGGHSDQLSRQHWGMDRFRIQALENILRHNSLSSADRTAALTILQEKIRILLLGAHKHDNQEVIRCYTQKQDYYNKLITTGATE